MADNKYREFRNYMTNDLGITRQDIEAWTNQSVANEVEKLIGNINVENLVSQTINKSADAAVDKCILGRGGRKLCDSMAELLAKKIKIEVTEQ